MYENKDWKGWEADSKVRKTYQLSDISARELDRKEVSDFEWIKFIHHLVEGPQGDQGSKTWTMTTQLMQPHALIKMFEEMLTLGQRIAIASWKLYDKTYEKVRQLADGKQPPTIVNIRSIPI
ncbi:hypothetical protein TNCT_88121 [Trichonephila clavata]|uniref:Uncharacterized protein n=1 Tax=Trichonephila clavata TaxID=2740835 RepID=A0A8X6IM20_TRICU|nr:hypothetical protein TNCT_88121 [Trichonephila clavata]